MRRLSILVPPSIEPHRFYPANREPPNSAPPVPGSSQLSWNEVSRRGGSSQKVPFGFRRSALSVKHHDPYFVMRHLHSFSSPGLLQAVLRIHHNLTAYLILGSFDGSSKVTSLDEVAGFSRVLTPISQRSRSMSPVVHFEFSTALLDETATSCERRYVSPFCVAGDANVRNLDAGSEFRYLD